MRAPAYALLVALFLLTACAGQPASEAPATTSSVPGATQEPAMFRGGPTHTGVYETAGVEQEPEVLWRFATGGRVVSSPAVVGDRVYVGSNDGALYAVDAATGAEVWRYVTGGDVRSSPAVAAGRVFFGSYDGVFYAVDAATGELAWRFETSGERRWRAANLDGMTPEGEVHTDPWDFFLSSPVVENGVVYFGTGEGMLYALDARSGAQLWALATADTIHSSPAVADGVVYVGNMESRLYAVDAATGEERWHYQAGVDPTYHNQHGLQSSPAVAHGRVYIGGRDGGLHVVDAASGEALWKFDTNNSWVLGSAAVAGDRVYLGTSDTNMLKAIDATTGEEIFGASLGMCIYSSPAIVADTLYVGTCGGVLFAVDAISGEVKWRYRTEAGERDDHGILLPDGGWDAAKLFANYTAEGAAEAVEKVLDLGSFMSSPALSNGVLYIGSADGHLYAFAPAQGPPQLPMAVANNAVAGLEVEGVPHLFSFSGLGAGKTNNDITSAAFSVNLRSDAVTRLADVPGDKNRLASIAVGLYDRIFIFGGYTVADDGGEVSTPEVYAFNPSDGSYQRRADMPTPVDDTVAFAYANRYIYLISGWHNEGNVSDVQVFDSWEDRWFTATAYPGTPVFGHAGGIVGNTIVIADGVGVVESGEAGRRFALMDEAYKGTINPEDPSQITWEALPPHPGAPLYRMAAVGSDAAGLVVFAGGSDNPYNYDGIGYNGEPSEPSARVFAFDPEADGWVELADKPLATMDHRGLIEFDDVFCTVGGMTDGQTVTGRIVPFSPQLRAPIR